MRLRGVSWNTLVRGLHIAGPFKSDHELRVEGRRGRWTWKVLHRPPPRFETKLCTEGQHRNKLAAMGAATDALKAILQKGDTA